MLPMGEETDEGYMVIDKIREDVKPEVSDDSSIETRRRHVSELLEKHIQLKAKKASHPYSEHLDMLPVGEETDEGCMVTDKIREDVKPEISDDSSIETRRRHVSELLEKHIQRKVHEKKARHSYSEHLDMLPVGEEIDEGCMVSDKITEDVKPEGSDDSNVETRRRLVSELLDKHIQLKAKKASHPYSERLVNLLLADENRSGNTGTAVQQSEPDWVCQNSDSAFSSALNADTSDQTNTPDSDVQKSAQVDQNKGSSDGQSSNVRTQSIVEQFNKFCQADDCADILTRFYQLTELIDLDHSNHKRFYQQIRSKVQCRNGCELWDILDQRVQQEVYQTGDSCPNAKVLIIGGGVCGLRMAIEVALLGGHAVVLEKRDSFSRNNIVRLWPFLMTDLKNLGAKVFYRRFSVGPINHISIRQLQCILLKTALVLGVQFHTNVSFIDLIEPEGPDCGWRAQIEPADHQVSAFEFDFVIGADGKKNSLKGFVRKKFRGKLALGITANFVNHRTRKEALVEEIGGLSYYCRQEFFNDLKAKTDIALENFVYYKDETHYFVMTAKKDSLLRKGVFRTDNSEVKKLLASENIDQHALECYAKEAADVCTDHQFPDLEFAIDHYGQSDVAIFDFTSLFSAQSASRVLERHGRKLLKILVGDSLIEPFWPIGTGCAFGFLSVLDGAWMIRQWCQGDMTPAEVVAEREGLYKMLSKVKPSSLHKNDKLYTIQPSTRYVNKNPPLKVEQVSHLFDNSDTEEGNETSQPADSGKQGLTTADQQTDNTSEEH